MYSSDNSLVQINMDSMLDTETELQEWYNNEIEKLVFANRHKEIIADIAYILSNNELFKILINKYTTYEQMNGKKRLESFYDFWSFVYKTIPKYFYKGMTETAFRDTRRKLLIDINRTKKSWANMAFASVEENNNKLLSRQLIECRQAFLREPEIVKEKYGIKKPDELINYYKNWFNKWNSWDRLMIEYPYLLDLTTKKLQNAFKLDLINCTTLIIMNEYNSNVKMIKSKRPEELIKIGIFAPTTRTAVDYKSKKTGKKILLENEVDYSEMWANTNTPNDGAIEMVKSLVSFDPYKLEVSQEQIESNEFMNNIISNTLAPDVLAKLKENPTAIRRLYSNLTLDLSDKKMIAYTFNKSQAQRVRVYYTEFLRLLGLSDGAKNFKMIEARVTKWPGYWYSGTMANGDMLSLNFISSVNVSRDETGRFADITLSQNLYQSIERGRVFQIYERELAKLKATFSEDLAYIFEMERKNLINMGADIYGSSFSYSIDFFKQFIYLDKKTTLKKNMDLLQTSIAELCDNKLIVKFYERHLDYFNIKFYPDTENSKNIINSTMSYLTDFNND